MISVYDAIFLLTLVVSMAGGFLFLVKYVNAKAKRILGEDEKQQQPPAEQGWNAKECGQECEVVIGRFHVADEPKQVVPAYEPGSNCKCNPKTPLCGATWTGATYNSETKFPAGFDPESHGMVKVK